eukprot:4630478-Prorocentrum_lima.AAC.1
MVLAGGCSTGGFSSSKRSIPSSVIRRSSAGECTRSVVPPAPQYRWSIGMVAAGSGGASSCGNA